MTPVKQKTQRTLATRLNDALKVLESFYQHQEEQGALLTNLVLDCQGLTAQEAREGVFLKAEEKFKKAHPEVTKMPGTWRTGKTTILKAMEAFPEEFNECSTWGEARRLYNARNQAKAEKTAKANREKAEEIATASDEQIAAMSAQDLQKAITGARREVLDRVGRWPNAFQVRFWQHETLLDLIGQIDQEFQTIKAEVEKDNAAKNGKEVKEEKAEAKAA